MATNLAHRWHGVREGSTISSTDRTGTRTEHAPPTGDDPLEVVDCSNGPHRFYRRTDLSPPEARPTICHSCYMVAQQKSHEDVAEPFLSFVFDDDRVEASDIVHTGGGCWAISLVFAGQAEGLEVLVGDDEGPLPSHPVERWGASVCYWSEDGEQDFDMLGYAEGTPAEVVDALAAIVARAATPSGREELDREERARWEARRAELLKEREEA